MSKTMLFVHIEALIQSMTPEERRNPDIINGRRRLRIAHGCGLEVSDVNQLLKQFRDMRKMMKTVMKTVGQAQIRRSGKPHGIAY